MGVDPSMEAKLAGSVQEPRMRSVVSRAGGHVSSPSASGITTMKGLPSTKIYKVVPKDVQAHRVVYYMARSSIRILKMSHLYPSEGINFNIRLYPATPPEEHLTCYVYLHSSVVCVPYIQCYIIYTHTRTYLYIYLYIHSTICI